MTTKLSPAARRALKRYGEDACLRAYELHLTHGYGASGIAQNYALNNVNSTQAADAAINAGRELINESAQDDFDSQRDDCNYYHN